MKWPTGSVQTEDFYDVFWEGWARVLPAGQELAARHGYEWMQATLCAVLHRRQLFRIRQVCMSMHEDGQCCKRSSGMVQQAIPACEGVPWHQDCEQHLYWTHRPHPIIRPHLDDVIVEGQLDMHGMARRRRLELRGCIVSQVILLQNRNADSE